MGSDRVKARMGPTERYSAFSLTFGYLWPGPDSGRVRMKSLIAAIDDVDEVEVFGRVKAVQGLLI